jgi:hypothetical protein
MKDNITQVSYEVRDTILVALRLNIVENWKSRRSLILRDQIKRSVRALREMRNAHTLFAEKYIWAK